MTTATACGFMYSAGSGTHIYAQQKLSIATHCWPAAEKANRCEALKMAETANGEYDFDLAIIG